MLQAFIITLREGVEAALIVGIVFAYLDKIDRRELKRTVFYALGAAIAASVGVAIVISHLNFNEDIFEGWVMLVAATFVVGMIWFMHKTARTMRGDIESKVSKLIGSKFGLFGFVFLMVLREGVETVLILAGVSLNSTELMSFTGTLLGIASAVVFGVMFIRGSVRINLQRFFRVTTVILYFVVFQLVVSGLHELSENGVLPSSTAEMRYIGPIVRNDLFFFITMLALAGLMVLFEYKRRAPIAIAADATSADRRKAEWLARREKLWMNAVVAVSFVFIFLSTAEFLYAQSSTALSAATPVTLIGTQVTVPTSEVTDNKLHRYSVRIDGADGKSTEVRFLLFKKPDGNLVSVADACHICGPVGFYIGEQGITCKMCSSPLVASSMGQPGGCNPIPLKSTIEGGHVVIAKADLQPLTAIFGGKSPMFLRLLWESFARQRRRKLLAGIAILLGATAVTAMLGLATTIGDRIHQELAVYGANIIVYPKADTLDVKVGDQSLKPATGNVYLHESDLTKLRGIFWANNITGVSPELTFNDGTRLLVAGKKSASVTFRGLWFDHDLQGLHTGAPNLHPLWKLDGVWPAMEKHADYVNVVLGAHLAQRLSLQKGAHFALLAPDAKANGITPEENGTVVGILTSGDAADDQVMVPLSFAQTGIGIPDAVSRIEISARTKPEDAFARRDPDTLSPKDHDVWYCRPYANSIAYQIAEAIPGAHAEQVRQVEQSEGTILERISGLMWLISAAALLAAAVAVSAAMATAVLERRAEIGLMRSLGASKGRIASLFYAEAGLLAIGGGACGYVAGSLLAAFLTAKIFGGTSGHTALAHAFNPVLLPVVLALALLVAIAGSTASIRGALRMDPSAVLRADA